MRTLVVSVIEPGTYMDPVRGTSIVFPRDSGEIFSTHSPDSTNFPCAIFNV